MADEPVDVWIGTLRASHDRLAGQVASVDMNHQSYCPDWSVAQVLSHLGSGAEIGVKNLTATRAGAEPLAQEDFPPIWDRWNAMSPEDQAAGFLEWDERHVSLFESLSADEKANLRIPFFGMELDVTSAAGFRLGEHATHAWDVAVAFDPTAVIAPDAVALLIDRLPMIAGFVGKADRAAGPGALSVSTSDPARQFRLAWDTAVSLTPEASDAGLGAGGGEARGTATMPAEALHRLVYGRLDPAHTPDGVTVEGPVSLDDLRAMFPGP